MGEFCECPYRFFRRREGNNDSKSRDSRSPHDRYMIGYVITVKSFVELTEYLLGLAELKGKHLLSECFSQDPLENYFGQQRSRGGWCQNPTVQACLTSAQSLRVQGSLAMIPVRGDSSRKR